jgi:hypothetical protein
MINKDTEGSANTCTHSAFTDLKVWATPDWVFFGVGFINKVVLVATRLMWLDLTKTAFVERAWKDCSLGA